MRSAEPLLPQTSAFDVQTAIGCLYKRKSHGIIKFQQNWLIHVGENRN